MTGNKMTGKEVLQQVAEEAFKARLNRDYQSALQDALIYGNGWLHVDASGKIKHVSPLDVVAWADFRTKTAPAEKGDDAK